MARFLMLVLIAMAFCAGAQTNTPPVTNYFDTILSPEHIFGKERLQIIAHPDSVLIYRIETEIEESLNKELKRISLIADPEAKKRAESSIKESLDIFGTPPAQPSGTIQGRGILLGPVALNTNQIQELVAIFTDRKSFDWDTACDVMPGICLQFKKGTQLLDLFICLHCGHVVIMDHGKAVGGAKIDDTVTRKLTDMAKGAFPNDKALSKPLH